MQLTPEQIQENFDKFRSLCEKLGDRSEAALAMIDTLGERLALCPASSHRDFHCAFLGGLVDHSLRVFINAAKLKKTFDWDISTDSLIIGSLFHDLGKVGDHEKDNYLPQTDDWRVNKLGEIFTMNKDLQYMDVPTRGIFLCQHFGLKLTIDETLAIKLNDGFVVDENRKYCLKTPKLAFAIMTADYIATMEEKGLF